MNAKMKEIREKETSAIEHELVEQVRHLFTLRSQAVTEKLANPAELARTRRQIARMKTVLRERQTQERRTPLAQA